jgi:hypothetical protein
MQRAQQLTAQRHDQHAVGVTAEKKRAEENNNNNVSNRESSAACRALFAANSILMLPTRY